MSENHMTPMPAVLRSLLRDNPAVARLDSEKGKLPLPSLMEEAVVLSESYLRRPRPILVVKQNLYNAQRLYERVSTLLGEEQCALFAADESLRVEAIASSPEMNAGQVETLSSLMHNPAQLVITSPSGFLRQLPFPETFRQACMHLAAGQTLDMEAFKRRLRAGGYFQTSHIDQPLSFAARGGIVDVYSINYDQPLRIEFFGDEIDSIRFFDAETQKTVSTIKEADIVPASSFLLSKEQEKELLTKGRVLLEEKPRTTAAIEEDLNEIEQGIRSNRLYPYMALLEKTAGLWDYMDDPLVIVSDPVQVEESTHRLLMETAAYIDEMVHEDKLLPKYEVFHEPALAAKSCRRMEEDPLYANISNIETISLPNEALALKLEILRSEPAVLFVLEPRDAARLQDVCQEENISLEILPEDSKEVPAGFSLLIRPLAEGFREAAAGVSVVSAQELFEIHHHAGRYERKFRAAEVLHSYEDLQPGDYIVHAQYGVGMYMGIETREVNGSRRDFLHIEYRGNDKLLVPLEQFRLVRKFVSREGVVPRLNKLGSTEWARTRARLEEDVSEVADRLVSLYASRTEHIGHAFAPDTPLQKKFEDAFPYELTPDQETAVADVKKDMESDKPMDRLICGDVGFGKTEIAVRAAFKAVSENKQTAVLCPTTILCEQHVQTFQSRFAGWPFTIKALDRYVPEEEVKKTLQGLKNGSVDIVIGTHRLLSKDVHFKDLGLLVIDEEQRFGVLQKEKIKEMRTGVDVLTLSATPIPRTLQMSLVGIRSMSQLETPPNNRYNVQTYVVEKNQGLIVDAIEKELARSGQVFYLFNNIDLITTEAMKLQRLIPDARIGVAHGRMAREQIEDTMMRFTRHEINVLVCTTIIENGIDIPNANTILIDNAQNFGLAQLYQIKGRVGRSDRIAYAYLMTPVRRSINETAQKRLQAVKEFARMGSGYRIAMRDLTIRGAGDLLGQEQSGFIDTVGIDMYIEMLEEAIQRRQGHVSVEKEEGIKHAQTPVSGYLPEDFAPDDYDKISMYQKIDALSNLGELESYRREVTDQYGRLPQEVETLFQRRQLDILCADPDVDSYKDLDGKGELTFSTLYSQKVDGVKLFEILNGISKDLKLSFRNGRIRVEIPRMKNQLEVTLEILQRAKEAYKDHAD